MNAIASPAEYKPTRRQKIMNALYPVLRPWYEWSAKYRKSNIEVWAEEELRRAGLFDDDSDYAGMIGPAVVDIIKVFGRQGHSGGSASVVHEAVCRLMRWKTLTPLTNDPAEWHNVSNYIAQGAKPVWQNRRQSSCFSEDGGNTYHDIDDENRTVRTAVDRKNLK